MNFGWLALAWLAFGALQGAPLAGDLPPQMSADGVRISWLSAASSDERQHSACLLHPPRGWICPQAFAGDAGIVIVDAEGIVGFVVMGEHGVIAAGTARWARLVQVSTSENSDTPIVTVSGLRINRPVNRPMTKTLDVTSEPDIEIWPISATAFWVAGNTGSADAFVRVSATGAASHDEPLEAVLNDSAQTPLSIRLEPPATLTGRVESQSGDVVDGAIVDLFALLPTEASTESPESLKVTSVVRVAQTRTDASGQFEIPWLEPHRYKIAVTDFSRGRDETWADTASPPVLIRLKAPATLTGRVLQQKLPVQGATVRFLPDPATWRESTDAAAHLTTDVSTDDSGRFVLPLPPVAAGTVQFVGPDGTSTRVQLPPSSKVTNIALGDVSLGESISVEVRTDAADCALSAVGPVGGLGFSIVRAESRGIVHAFQLPEAGQWLMQAECGGAQRRVAPPGIDVGATGGTFTFDLHVIDEPRASGAGR